MCLPSLAAAAAATDEQPHAAKKFKGNTFVLTHIFSCRSYFSATAAKSQSLSGSETVMSGFFILFAPGEGTAGLTIPVKSLKGEVRKYRSVSLRSPAQCEGNAADRQSYIFGGILGAHGKHPSLAIYSEIYHTTHGIAPRRGNGTMTRGELSA